jgi:hypothetical protein
MSTVSRAVHEAWGLADIRVLWPLKVRRWRDGCSTATRAQKEKAMRHSSGTEGTVV